MSSESRQRPRKIAEYREGKEAQERFKAGLGRILTVSKEELTRREVAYQESRAHKTRPGPRRKAS